MATPPRDPKHTDNGTTSSDGPTPRSPVTHLRHVALAVPDFSKTVAFYESTWGLTRVADDGDVAFFAAEGSPEQYIVRIREAPTKRIDLISFGAADTATVDSLAAEFIAAGVHLEREPGKLRTPGDGYGFRFFDPEGRLVEISSDVESRPYRELEAREAIPKSLSHVVINSTDIQGTKAFYETRLGFKLSDWLEDKMCFLRSGTEHHSIAIASGPHASLNHVSFEMRGIDEYMRATGVMMRHGYEPVWGPGRHGAGDNTFSYFLEPNGNIVEYTAGLQKIDDDWSPGLWSTSDPEQADQWGTGGPREEFVPAAMNDPDTGLWTPAPL